MARVDVWLHALVTLLVLSTLLMLLLARTIQAALLLPQAFNGEVRVGGQLKGGQEFRVKAFDVDKGQLVSVPLNTSSVNITAGDGSFGQQAPFALRGMTPLPRKGKGLNRANASASTWSPLTVLASLPRKSPTFLISQRA